MARIMDQFPLEDGLLFQGSMAVLPRASVSIAWDKVQRAHAQDESPVIQMYLQFSRDADASKQQKDRRAVLVEFDRVLDWTDLALSDLGSGAWERVGELVRAGWTPDYAFLWIAFGVLIPESKLEINLKSSGREVSFSLVLPGGQILVANTTPDALKSFVVFN